MCFFRSLLLTGKSFLVTVGLCCLRSIGFGLFYLRLKIGLVFFTYGSPRPKIGFGLFLLTVPPVQKLVLVFLTYSSPTVSKKDEP